ncbi:MAG: 1-acyl-sn-glycerol-3-phosphate acyltransferase [Phycisphaerae bacterium]|nr:1-acyl-sn-glycerol-3-phosphate acyltransferase [Phycisphaerae bacterium]
MRVSWRVLRLLAHLAGRYFPVHFHGQQRVPLTGGVLILSNHQSYLDPILVGMPLFREAAFMARDTLFRGALGRLIRHLNAFPVRRATADVSAIKETLRRLRTGWAVIAFPEGTRSVDGSIGTMRSGMAVIARRAEVPIVPAFIDGAFEAWPRNARWPQPHTINVAYGAPIAPAEYAGLSDDQLIELVRTRIESLRVATRPGVNGSKPAPSA